MKSNVRHICYAMIVFLMFLFIMPLKADAAGKNRYIKNILSDDTAPEVKGEGEEGTIIYSYGDGEFETNISDGQTIDLGYFRWDENLNITLMKDGKQIPYESEDIIYIKGDYIAIIYDNNSGEFTSMRFSVNNSVNIDLNDNENADISDVDSEMKELEEMFNDGKVEGASFLSMDYTFDYDNSSYVYEAAGENLFVSSVPNNAVTTDTVIVKSATGSMTFVYKDGEVIIPKDNKYSEPGFYDISTYIYVDDENKIPKSERSADSNYYITHFVFTIINPEDGTIGVINAPYGFNFSKILFNDREMNLPEYDFYFPEKDGTYKFTFVSEKYKDIIYEMEYKRDTVAPFVKFNQELNDHKGVSPLSYTVNDPDASVYVTSGDTVISMDPGQEVNYTGWFKFRAVDNAGNERFYSVYIKPKFVFFSPGMKILIGALAVCIIAYLLTVRFTKYDVNGRGEER